MGLRARHVRIEPSGKVFAATGVTTQGQGHPPGFAQIAAARLALRPEPT